MRRGPTALIADDEPLLREALARHLTAVWPELAIVAKARNGREALRLFDEHLPDVCFLDVQMPGIDGVTVARQVGGRAHVVFVTAFDRYAVEAFREGAVDYLLKPVEPERLVETVNRLRDRLRAAEPAPEIDALLERISAQLRDAAGSPHLRWIRAQSGHTLHLISVDDVDYLQSDHKLTRVAWRDASGKPVDALVRTPLKELAAQLDPAVFAQVHRSIVVNLRAVKHVRRDGGDSAEIHLRDRAEVLPVSRSFLHLFRQM